MALHRSIQTPLIFLLAVCWTCILASTEDSVETLLNDKIISSSNQKPESIYNYLKLLAKVTNDDGAYYPLYPALKKKVSDKFLGLNYLPKRNNNPSSGNNGMMCHFKLCNLGRRR